MGFSILVEAAGAVDEVVHTNIRATKRTAENKVTRLFFVRVNMRFLSDSKRSGDGGMITAALLADLDGPE